jgi:muconate cycloisomerase
MKISSIRARPLALSFKEPYHWAGRVDYGSVSLFIEVETDQGVTGYGEIAASRPAEAALHSLHGITPLFIGQSPYDIERLVYQARFLGGFNHDPRSAHLILAGIEMALWDIIGKAANRPVYQLLGGAFRDQVDYFGFVQGDTADQLAVHARQLAADGYSVIYMKVGRGEQLDLANTAAVRAAIGGRKLRLDANEAWDVHTAIYMIRRLAIYEPEFIEQPTPAQSLAALRQVKEAVQVPIAADQAVFSLFDVYEVCRQRAADLIVLSFHEAGGLLNFKKAAAIAQAAGIQICLHGQSLSGITDCAQHQLALTLPNLASGNQIMHQLLVEDLILSPDLTPRQGKLPVLPHLALSQGERWKSDLDLFPEEMGRTDQGLFNRAEGESPPSHDENLPRAARPARGSEKALTGLGFELDWPAIERAAERYLSDPHYQHL